MKVEFTKEIDTDIILDELGAKGAVEFYGVDKILHEMSIDTIRDYLDKKGGFIRRGLAIKLLIGVSRTLTPEQLKREVCDYIDDCVNTCV